MTSPAASAGHAGRSGRRRAPARSRRLRIDRGSLVVSAAVLIANVVYLTGVRSNNPLMYRSALATPASPWIPGRFTIDPNDGETAQALGRLAAQTWLHGHIPLWNFFEGIGTPLAGEMQSGAFSPFVLLQALPNGIFWMHLLLEIVAAVATYWFARMVGLWRGAAIAGGVAFGVNGTFVWLTNAAFAPVAFIPVCLVGVEVIRRTVAQQRRSPWGWILLGAGLALSVVAGFPETAYFDGMLVGVWSVVRWVQLRGLRWAFARQVIFGGVCGLALSGPVLSAFVAFLGFADVGGHATTFAHTWLPPQSLGALFAPYVYGPLFGAQAGAGQTWYGSFWGGVGGYVAPSVAALALVGLVSRRSRLERGALVVFALFCLGRIYGPGVVVDLINVVPGMKSVAGFRYATPALEFAVLIAAMFGLDALRERASGRLTSRRVWVAAGLAVLVFGGLGVVAVHGVGSIVSAHRHVWAWGSLGWSVLCVVAVLVAAVLAVRCRGSKIAVRAAVGVVVLVAVDAMALFALPQLSASPSAAVDTAPITYLQRHLGTYRFYSIGTIAPNYGSYYGIAQLDTNDLPNATAWADYVQSSLYPGTIRNIFPGKAAPGADPGTAIDAFFAHQDAYREAGVKYLVTSVGRVSAQQAAANDLTRVFADKRVVIYQVADPAPFWDTSGACQVVSQSFSAVSLHCATAATLVRHELDAPGWSARVNGSPVAVSGVGGTFQSVPVPAGDVTVTFRYRPRFFVASVVVSGVALVAMATAVVLWWRRRARGIEPRDGSAGSAL